MEILKFLDHSEIVKNYFVKDFKTFTTGFYLKIVVSFVNNSQLFISEYVDELERNYSYHWQNENNKLILRFDNAPYHPQIQTYPHHIHNSETITSNKKISAIEILSMIEEYFIERFK